MDLRFTNLKNEPQTHRARSQRKKRGRYLKKNKELTTKGTEEKERIKRKILEKVQLQGMD